MKIKTLILIIIIIGIASLLIVKAKSINNEYEHISKELGTQGKDWKLIRQALVKGEDGKRLDVLTVEVIATGEIKDYRFEVK